MLDWMAWTWQTALFFCLVALALIILTLLAIYRPESPRVGILRFPTTRGDRFNGYDTTNPAVRAGLHPGFIKCSGCGDPRKHAGHLPFHVCVHTNPFGQFVFLKSTLRQVANGSQQNKSATAAKHESAIYMRDLGRLKCIQAVVDGDLKPIRAADRLGLTTRQVRTHGCASYLEVRHRHAEGKHNDAENDV